MGVSGPRRPLSGYVIRYGDGADAARFLAKPPAAAALHCWRSRSRQCADRVAAMPHAFLRRSHDADSACALCCLTTRGSGSDRSRLGYGGLRLARSGATARLPQSGQKQTFEVRLLCQNTPHPLFKLSLAVRDLLDSMSSTFASISPIPPCVAQIIRLHRGRNVCLFKSLGPLHTAVVVGMSWLIKRSAEYHSNLLHRKKYLRGDV
jgi:hypothetical protein